MCFTLFRNLHYVKTKWVFALCIRTDRAIPLLTCTIFSKLEREKFGNGIVQPFVVYFS